MKTFLSYVVAIAILSAVVGVYFWGSTLLIGWITGTAPLAFAIGAGAAWVVASFFTIVAIIHWVGNE